MRFASYIRLAGTPTWGVEHGGLLFDLGPSGVALSDSLGSAVREGTLDSGIGWESAPSSAVSDAEFLPPIVDPVKVICIGVNYRSHRDEIGKPAPAAPTVFTRFADTQIGHLRPTIMPKSSAQFDYEGELAVVIGSPAFHLDASEAMSAIAGYGIYNDFTARDWQRDSSQWIPGKNFPATGAFGPYLVPAADIDDVGTLEIETRVNGEVRQSATLADLIFDIPDLIAYVTAFTPLAPGDVIVTGTPGGVGMFMDPPALLSVGDIVDVSITGLGVLTNTVAAETGDD